VTHDSYRFPTVDYDANNGRLVQKWRWGIAYNGVDTHEVIPIDVEIGMGFSF
jgi:hypothetical protein